MATNPAGLWDQAIDGPPRLVKRVPDLSTFWRILVVGPAAFWLVAAVAAFSDAALSPFILVLLFVFGMVLAVAWVFWTIDLLRGPRRLRTRFDWASWVFVPAAGLLGLVLLMTDWDLVLRLRLSEPALLRLVAEGPSQRQIRFTDQNSRVGLFQLKSADFRDGCVLFRSSAEFEEGGLVYSPGKPPPAWSPEFRFSHLTGPWWRYENNY